MKEAFSKSKQLIIERELQEDNLEKAEHFLLEYIQNNKDAWAFGLLSEIAYWKGEIAPKELKISLYEKGIEYGKKGIEIDSKNIESQFWLSVCYALLGEEQGIINSFFLLGPIEAAMEASLKIDESYFFGGPLRVAGMFYHKIPSWPISKGDNKKAIEYMLKSLKYGPEFFMNHIYISQIYLAIKEMRKAREHLEWILNADATRKFAKENQRYKLHAQKLLETI